jgi:hypothetical protein
VLKFATHRFTAISAGLVFAVAMLPAMATGQASRPTHARVQQRLVKAADITFEKGFHATLPPHISTLLGVSKEAPSAVMQSVVRSGSVVQGLDVVSEKKNDIVLFVVDESSKDQTLYLTSPEGTLRRVVAITNGVGSEARISDKYKAAFEKEKQFWVDRLAPVGKAK